MNPIVHSAAAADLSGDEYLEVTGSDRVDWLHGLCTQNIRILDPGQGAYACHIDVKARILADMQVMVFPDRIWLRADPGVGRTLRRSLRKYIVMEDVKLRTAGDMASLGIFGPDALDRLMDRGAPSSLASLPDHHWLDLYDSSLAIDAIVVKDPRMGVPGFRFIADAPSLATFAGQLGLAVATAQEQEAARIRHGIPRMHPDLEGGVLFGEAGLPSALHQQKGCYLGQEVVERVNSKGRVSRRLLPIQIACTPDNVPPQGATIETDRNLGALTSVAWQEDLGYAAALGFVHRRWEPPAPITVVAEGATWEATVHPPEAA